MASSDIAPLSAWDYVVFAAMLALSTAIGLFYAFSGGRQRTQAEFLMANRSMGVIPVSLSLLASFMSAITLLGTPSTLYQFGTQYWMIGPSYIFVCAISAHVFLPIFYRLEITSVYEYLEMRFSRIVRILGCATFLVQMIMYMGIVLYAPALAMSAVTGMSWWVSVIVLGVVCTFYTTIGGMKAVMWTDVLQITIMFSGMIAVGVVGTQETGGIEEVWRIFSENERYELWNVNPDPTERHTVWCLVIGATFTWLVIYGVNQSQVQRYLTSPTLRQAQLAIWINLPGLWGLLTVCAFTGVVAFSYYFKKGCDPLTSKEHIKTGDQILPLFVMEVLNYTGFRGLFIATIFSGALSTISSGVNALAAVTLEDIVKPVLERQGKELSDERGAVAAKVMAALYGVVALLLAFVASQMGDSLSAALSLFGMVGGPLLGLFTLGVLFPCANWQGAVAGHLVGELMSLWVGFGGFIYPPPVYRPPVATYNCPGFNTTVAPTSTLVPPVYQGLSIYRMSYMWQGAWAVAVTVTVGLIVSALTGFHPRESRNPRLVFSAADALCCCLPERAKAALRGAEGRKSDGAEMSPSKFNAAFVPDTRSQDSLGPSQTANSKQTLV